MKKHIKHILAIIVFVFFAHSAQPAASNICTIPALFEELKTAVPSNRTCYKKLIALLRLNSEQGMIHTSHLSTLKHTLYREAMANKNELELQTYFAHVLHYISDLYQAQTPELATTQCSICLENLPPSSIILTCNHAFCYECLFNWFTQHDIRKSESANTQCPNCRQAFAPHVKQLFITDRRFKAQSSKHLNEFIAEEEQTLQQLRQQAAAIPLPVTIAILRLLQSTGALENLPNNIRIIISFPSSAEEAPDSSTDTSRA